MEYEPIQAQEEDLNGTERFLFVLLGAGLLYLGLRRTLGRLLLAATGGFLVYQGMRGQSSLLRLLGREFARPAGGTAEQPVAQPDYSVTVHRTITINRAPDEVYLFWRNLEHLPRFMQHLKSVTTSAGNRSHWVAAAPVGDIPIEWDAQITAERANELIEWASLPGSDLITSGKVEFRPAPGGRGTEVHLDMEYAPPGGVAGAAFARLFDKMTAQQIKEDMRRLKEAMETGETATVKGQPKGGTNEGGEQYAETGPASGRAARRVPRDVVEDASEQSFPASDPPSYSMGREEE